MHALTRTAFLLILLMACMPVAAQTTPPAKQPTGSITGRVTVSDKGVIHAVVLLYGVAGIAGPAMTKTSTDQDGRYRFNNVAAGQYTVVASTPAYVWSDSSGFGKAVALDEGEVVENVDFSLVRGGVITGRVTDLQGRPVIGEQVYAARAGSTQAFASGNWSLTSLIRFTTDDRGIYRVFGLPVGRYLVAVGQESSRSQITANTGRPFFRRTYHPDAAELPQAKAIEVTEGGEVAGVDITVGRAGKRYSAAGRLTDEATGKVAPNIPISHAALSTDGKQLTGIGAGHRSDPKGNFRLEGLLPGRYVAFVTGGDRDGYAAPISFEISDKDVTGLELRLKRGATVNGLAVLTGLDNPAAGAQLNKLQIHASLTPGERSTPGSYSTLKINPDGSFRLAGLTPGKLTFFIVPTEGSKNFSILQVERDGVPQAEGVIVSSEDSAIQVKVVVSYGAGIVRGQLKTENGELLPGVPVWAEIFSAGKPTPLKQSRIDANGRFQFEGLATGEYEVVVTTYVLPEGQKVPTMPKIVKEKVFVTSGSESRMALTLDLGRGKKEGRIYSQKW